MVCSRFSR
uniref:Uncharacterized protein n=1 Tax=Anguilla anguilla TaxID=7936 RepID=A0A0E9UB56_ANGAN